MFWKVVFRLGVGGLILGFLIVIVSIVLFRIISNGANLEDALLGIIPGALLIVVSFLLILVGWVFVSIKGKKSEDLEEPEDLEKTEDLEKSED